jgi:hypothetical protein
MSGPSGGPLQLRRLARITYRRFGIVRQVQISQALGCISSRTILSQTLCR